MYLNSTEAIWTQESLTLSSDVSPPPLKQVDDGCPAVLKMGGVLGEAEPQQSHQNEELHVLPGRFTLDEFPATKLLFILPLSF